MKLLQMNIKKPIQYLKNREINNNLQKYKGYRIIIQGDNCYVNMWNISDLLISFYEKYEKKGSVYIIPHLQNIDNNDIDLIENSSFLLITDIEHLSNIDSINYLQYKNGTFYDITHKNLCFISRSCKDYSKEWIPFHKNILG